jgi:hypothetical protein
MESKASATPSFLALFFLFFFLIEGIISPFQLWYNRIVMVDQVYKILVLSFFNNKGTSTILWDFTTAARNFNSLEKEVSAEISNFEPIRTLSREKKCH